MMKTMTKIKNIIRDIKSGNDSHKNFMDLVSEVKMLSDDYETQVGCVLSSSDNKFFTIGVNKLPKKLEKTVHRTTRPHKYDYIEHSERIVIERFIRKFGYEKLKNSKIYLDGYPCPDCMKQLAIFNISKIYINDVKYKNWSTNPKWKEKEYISKEIARECGILIVHIFDIKPGIYESLKNPNTFLEVHVDSDTHVGFSMRIGKQHLNSSYRKTKDEFFEEFFSN